MMICIRILIMLYFINELHAFIFLFKIVFHFGIHFCVGPSFINKAINKHAEFSIYHCFPNQKTAFHLFLIVVTIN